MNEIKPQNRPSRRAAAEQAVSHRQHLRDNQARKKQNSKVLMQQKQRRRKLLTFWRITKYGANSFLRNAWLSVAATAVMTVTLVIIFGSLIARTVLIDTVDEIKDKVDMSIYLKRDAKESDVEKIKKSLEDLKTVTAVSYVSPEVARSNFAKEKASDDSIQQALIEAQGGFFGILNIKLEDISNTSELKNFVDNDKTTQANLDPDHKPTYASDRKEVIDNISNSVNFAERVGILMATIFVILASLIIFNTIRMAIFNRREEIYMMKLIGANKSFIAGPFLVEAVICGVVSAVIASVIGYAIVILARSKLEAYGIVVSPVISLLQNYAILVVIGLMIVGSIIGVISSFTATRKYLKI